MLNGLESGLQRRFERQGPYEMFQELKLIFQENTRVERYEVSNKFYLSYGLQNCIEFYFFICMLFLILVASVSIDTLPSSACRLFT